MELGRQYPLLSGSANVSYAFYGSFDVLKHNNGNYAENYTLKFRFNVTCKTSRHFELGNDVSVLEIDKILIGIGHVE